LGVVLCYNAVDRLQLYQQLVCDQDICNKSSHYLIFVANYQLLLSLERNSLLSQLDAQSILVHGLLRTQNLRHC